MSAAMRIRKRWSKDQKFTTINGFDVDPFISANHVVVVHNSRVGVKLGPFGHADEVAAFLRVNNHDAFARDNRLLWLHAVL